MDADLDAVQASIERWNGLNTEDATALVAELRAARDAHRDLQWLHEDLDALDVTAASAHRLRRILDTWDKVAGDGA